MPEYGNCHLCQDKCPQEERAREASLGRMYATKELIELQKKTTWISVNERLPEYGQDVLLIAHGWDTDNGDVYIGKRKTIPANDGSNNFWGIPIEESEWTIYGWSYFRNPNVTYWMPIPEPPKED